MDQMDSLEKLSIGIDESWDGARKENGGLIKYLVACGKKGRYEGGGGNAPED